MAEQLFTAIAKEHLSIETLETRRSASTMSLSGESAQPWKLPTRQAPTLNATPFDDLQLPSSKNASRKPAIFTPQLMALPISLTMSFAH